LVAQGRVTKVDYRTSQPSPNGHGRIPYTFVTYQFSSVLRGDPSSRSITLRFIGGSDGQGSFMDVSGVPRFQVGEEDILFIQGNADTGCPLAGCIRGRYRVLNGAVYDGLGSPVRSVAEGRISSGGLPPAEFLSFKYPAPEFDELIKNPAALASLRQSGVSIAEARQRYQAETPAQIEVKTVVSPRGRGDSAGSGEGEAAQQQAAAQPLGVNDFLGVVRSAVASAPPPGPVSRADSGAAIRAPSAAAAPPPAVRQNNAPLRSPGDAAEERRLPKDAIILQKQQ
jgi:hypothetical protein